MLAKRFGVCGNPITGYPDAFYMRSTKMGWLRSLVLDFSTFEAMYNTVPNTTNIAAVMTGQTQGLSNDFWSDGWQDRFTTCVREFCERFYKRVRLIEFMNEWDTWDNSDRAAKAVEISILGTNICKEYGILGFLGSVASGTWQDQLEEAIQVLDDAEEQMQRKLVHGFCFHPYVSYVERIGIDGFIVPNKSEPWESLTDKVRRAIHIAGGRTCAITEGGIKIGDAGGVREQELYVHGWFEELAQFTVNELICATYFAWTDINGAPSERGDAAFGWIAEDGSLRPAYFAGTYQLENDAVVDLPVEWLLTVSQAQPSVPGQGEPQAPQEPPETGEGSLVPPATETPPQSSQGGRVSMLTIEDAHQIRWQAIISHAPYNHTFGFERAWRLPDNAWWGSPLTADESVLPDGRPVRAFANAVIAYNGDGSTEVL